MKTVAVIGSGSWGTALAVQLKRAGNNVILWSFKEEEAQAILLNGENKEEVIEETKKEVMNMLKKTIRPEFLNRIDETIMFLPLTESEIKQIVVLQIKGVQKMLAQNGVELILTEGAIEFLTKVGYDPEFGARPVKRAIQHYLLNDLSKKLLSQEVDRSKPITVDASGEELVFRN